MGKRKRDESTEAKEEPDDSRKRRLLKEQIALGIRELTTCLEQARRFERQKLGRRQHDRKRSNSDSRRLNVEIAVLKALDMRKLAEQRLHKNLVKTQSIAKTGLLPEEVKLPANGSIDKPTADLMGRLFKQRGVVEAQEGTMAAVRRILGLQNGGGGAKRAKHEEQDEQDEPKSFEPALQDGYRTTSRDSSPTLSSDEAIQKSHSRPDPNPDTDSNSEEFAAFDDWLASSSSSDQEYELGSNSDMNTETAIPKPTTSAFLPSLSMGGYMSGSETDATDVEEHIAPRKNRRGQRARQAIWEKKYKDKAKHLKKQSKKKDKRDEGWDLQRGAVSKDDSKGSKRFGGGKKATGLKQTSSGGNAALSGDRKGMDEAVESKPKHRDDAGALHPSWQAKKQMKQQSIGIGGFKGRKVTFG
jgi:hypothetical protein